MAMRAFLTVALMGTASFHASAEEVKALVSKAFDQHLKDNKQTLIEFYAPWCGHCKKLAPEFEKAAVDLRGKAVLAKVDATEEKDLATKYNVKGFPTLIWFEDGQQSEYDGGRTAETIVEWVNSMTGPAVNVASSMPSTSGLMPNIALFADSLQTGFESAAKTNRRKAAWYFIKSQGPAKVVLQHAGEDQITMEGGIDQALISSFLSDNALPLFGKLDGDTFDKYMEAGKGLVWSLFDAEKDGSIEEIERKYRPMMSEVARKVKGRYFVTYTDTAKFKEAVESMLGVTEYPAVAVQKKAGDKKKFALTGEDKINENSAQTILQFIEDVEAGRVDPKLKSEPVPDQQSGDVRVVVGTSLQKEVFQKDKDVMLEVYAPWCGHCKKLDPEYVKLGKKIKKEELTDLLGIAKIDGTANDSPVDHMEWTGFPTIYFVKAGAGDKPCGETGSSCMVYEGERTAKGLWKYIKKHATKADEIKNRMERRKRKAEEL